MPGFKTTTRSGIVLAVGQQVSVPFTLEVGQVTEQVTVTAEAPLLDTARSRPAQNFDSRMVEGLPMFSNMPIMLARFAAGREPVDEPDAGVAGLRGRHHAGAPAAPIGGVGSNNYTIDGATNNGSGRRIAASPNSDMIQEMRVESSNFDASVGHGLGLQISMMTRAGTNQYRGTGELPVLDEQAQRAEPEQQKLTFDDRAQERVSRRAVRTTCRSRSAGRS